MNPSVCVHQDALHVNIRLVNYRMDEHGRYLIRNTETGDVNNDNPINTNNMVLYLGLDPFYNLPWGFECYRPGNMPVEYPLVIGFEDMRIWSSGSILWGSSTVRQLAADGQCEQVMTSLTPHRENGNDVALRHGEPHRMLREPRETEKNWAPIIRP